MVFVRTYVRIIRIYVLLLANSTGTFFFVICSYISAAIIIVPAYSYLFCFLFLFFQCFLTKTEKKVPTTSTEKEINTAYKKLALKYHPDRTRGDEASAEKFKEIATAYAVSDG